MKIIRSGQHQVTIISPVSQQGGPWGAQAPSAGLKQDRGKVLPAGLDFPRFKSPVTTVMSIYYVNCVISRDGEI